MRSEGKRRRTAALLCACGAAVILVGCGFQKKQENLEAGMAAVEALDYDTALECFEKAVVAGEDMELIDRGRGIAYIGKTDYENAAAALESSLSYCNGNIGNLEFDTNYYLATAYYKSGNADGARAVYDAILDLRQNEKAAYYLRGKLELEQDDFEKASADFEKAIALNVKDFDCIIDIYRSLEENGYKEAGMGYIQNALAEGGNKISDYDKGRLCYYLEDYENARNSLEKARDTGSAEAVLYLGRTYEALGDYNYAASVYANFLDGDPNSPEVLNQLGICRMQMGNYEEALSAFQTGLAIEENSYIQTLRFNEIAAFERLGQFAKARTLMQNYLKLYPDDARAKREYDFLKTR